MPRIVGGCGPCARRKAARPRWFACGTSAPALQKTTVSSLTCCRVMAESTAENRPFSGYDRPGPFRGGASEVPTRRCGVAPPDGVQTPPYPAEKNKKATLKNHKKARF